METKVASIYPIRSAETAAGLRAEQSAWSLLLPILGEDCVARLRKACGEVHALRRMAGVEVIQAAMLTAEEARALQAVLDFAWMFLESPWPSSEPLRTSEQVFQAFRGRLGCEKVEVVWVVLLDARLRPLESVEVSRGSVAGALLHPRDVLRPVLLRQAASFIVLHNHPSGDPEPSRADLDVTRKIARAAEVFQIDFLDHIIVTAQKYYSFADKRRLA